MTGSSVSARMREMAAEAPVIAVLTLRDPAHALPLADALSAGGVAALEVTLRTEAALPAIRDLRRARPGVLVGAGTVLTADDLDAALEAGAAFTVSPGATDALLAAACARGAPFLPGAASAGEAMRLLEFGIDFAKLFPAEPVGGVALLKALAAPLPQMAWCPTGGVSPENAGAYLALPTVLAVGGSWLAPPAALEAGDWAGVEGLARRTLAALRPN